MRLNLSLVGVLILIIVVGILDSPTDDETSSSPLVSQDASQQVNNEEATDQKQDSPSYTSLEYILEEKKEEDGYVVETYREYEIYEDEQGNVIKRVPTSNYDALRYKIYED